MSIFTKKKKVVTHDGDFHTDDIFATAVISILEEGNIKIIRTRDKDMFKDADYIYDVGGESDDGQNKFDHHQKGGAGTRSNGVPYASFGLVWKKFGAKICDGDVRVAERVDKKLACPIDATDNGVDIYKIIFEGVHPYDVNKIFLSEKPTWKELGENKNIDLIFKRQVDKAVYLLKREIKIAKDDVLGEKIIEESSLKAEDKRIIILDTNLPRYLYQNFLSKYREPIYIILPSNNSNNWKIEAIRKNEETMESRKPFPKNWRGELNKEKLAGISGIDDIEFCHNSGFLCETKTKEGAIKLAEKALIS